MWLRELEAAPPSINPPQLSPGRDDEHPMFIDCLIELLIACEQQIHNTEREWIIATMRKTKTDLLTLAVTFFYDTKHLHLSHYLVDGEAVVIVHLQGDTGLRFVGHLWWTSFGESAIEKVVRYLGMRTR